MELETFIQTQLGKERERFGIESDPVARQRLVEWISAMEGISRSADTIQMSIDVTGIEVNNQTCNAEELYRPGRPCSGLEWLQGALRQARAV
jgi:hypothetical protein